MNKVEKELKNILDVDKPFSDASEKAVLQRIKSKTNRKHMWKMPLVVFALAAICLLFIFSLPKQNLTSSSLAETLNETLVPGTFVLLTEQKNITTSNDALIAYILKDHPEFIVTEYYLYENKEWQKTDFTIISMNQDAVWKNQNGLYTGIYRDQTVKDVYVGEDKATNVEYDDYHYWYYVANDKINSVNYAYQDGSFERMQEYIGLGGFGTSFVPTANLNSLTDYEVIKYLSDNMDQTNHEYYKYPLILNRAVTELGRGDVIQYERADGTKVISRIVGQPNEKFSIQNGTIILNSIPLNNWIGYAKVRGETSLQNYLNKYKDNIANIESAKELFTMTMEEVTLSENQYMVVPDNWMRGSIEVVSNDQIVGKIEGYNPYAMNGEWTNTELSLYDAFKASYDLKVLKDAEPVTIARLYMYADLLQDAETMYHLLTNRQEYQAFGSKDEFLSNEFYSPKEDPEPLIEIARKLALGNFYETDDFNGYIKYGEGEGMIGFQLVKSEEGIWQVAYMAMQ